MRNFPNSCFIVCILLEYTQAYLCVVCLCQLSHLNRNAEEVQHRLEALAKTNIFTIWPFRAEIFHIWQGRDVLGIGIMLYFGCSLRKNMVGISSKSLSFLNFREISYFSQLYPYVFTKFHHVGRDINHYVRKTFMYWFIEAGIPSYCIRISIQSFLHLFI